MIAFMQACGDIELGVAVVHCECGGVRQHDRPHGYLRSVRGAPDPACSGCRGTGEVRVDYDFDTGASIMQRCSCLDAPKGPVTLVESIARAMRHG